MAFKGKNFIIQLSNGEVTPVVETFTTVGGMRTTSMTINNEQVDITDKDGSMWKKLLEAAGVQSMSVKLAGVFKDEAKLNACMAQAVANTVKRFKLISESGETFIGPFAIPSLERAGEYNKEETYSLTLDSADEIDYTAAP